MKRLLLLTGFIFVSQVFAVSVKADEAENVAVKVETVNADVAVADKNATDGNVAVKAENADVGAEIANTENAVQQDKPKTKVTSANKRPCPSKRKRRGKRRGKKLNYCPIKL